MNAPFYNLREFIMQHVIVTEEVHNELRPKYFVSMSHIFNEALYQMPTNIYLQ
jgi:hypothetical protein